jgi:putative component of membrane protein insertase Oxa1/YidC/SpoIIIJ protein YidD
MRRIALAMIALYQRFVSPIKGFSCAYRASTGGAGCSAHGYRVIERYGMWMGLRLLKRRLDSCSREYRKHIGANRSRAALQAPGRHQAGYCDVSCDACDLGSCACDVLGNCGSLPCDPFDGRRRHKDDEQWVEIEPNSTRT